MKNIQLTQNQQDFLLNYFFKNEEYAGWKSIAIELLATGQCIVSGTESIWHGGIGNFIELETAKGAVGCSLYTFDSESFFSGEWYKGIMREYLTEQVDKIKQLNNEVNEVAEITDLYLAQKNK